MRSVLIALAAIALSLPAAAVEIESVTVEHTKNTLHIAGSELHSVETLSLTDEGGGEVFLRYTVTRGGLSAKVDDLEPGTYRLRAYGKPGFMSELPISMSNPVADAVDSDAFSAIQATSHCSGTSCAVNVICPRGTRVTGGGFMHVGYYDIFVNASYPVSGRVWRVEAEALNPKAHFTSIRGYAVCVQSE